MTGKHVKYGIKLSARNADRTDLDRACRQLPVFVRHFISLCPTNDILQRSWFDQRRSNNEVEAACCDPDGASGVQQVQAGVAYYL